MGHCNVTLLSPKYLSNENILREISYWLRIAKRPQGWHYDMDEAWLLEHLEKANISKGATILDAGAGLGIMQYVLAAKGYNVVSLDFCKRNKPKELNGIFDLCVEDQEALGYQHAYQEFIVHDSKTAKPEKRSSLLSRLKKPHSSLRVLYKIKREVLSRFYRLREKLHANPGYGKITFVRGAFHEIPFKDDTFDAVVSVSALEHADISLLDKNFTEMKRVAKPNAPVLISTSAIDHDTDHFDEKTQGWCFSAKTISRFADNAHGEYEKYKEIEQKILQSEIWRSRIDPYYFTDPSSPLYQRNATHLPYLPIGIYCTK